MAGWYEIGQHSADPQHMHVAYVLDGNREDLFDVELYYLEPDATDGALIESREALALLVARANEFLSQGEDAWKSNPVEVRLRAEAVIGEDRVPTDELIKLVETYGADSLGPYLYETPLIAAETEDSSET